MLDELFLEHKFHNEEALQLYLKIQEIRFSAGKWSPMFDDLTMQEKKKLFDLWYSLVEALGINPSEESIKAAAITIEDYMNSIRPSLSIDVSEYL